MDLKPAPKPNYWCFLELLWCDGCHKQNDILINLRCLDSFVAFRLKNGDTFQMYSIIVFTTSDKPQGN
ncbi:hypothetical protein KY46_03100 [Photobacterium halotolerans]|uniref:Uncharacterized protein n=1 Tax=Photobacterium halotolerans TaxID=265726 RepID=A0A0F5VH59_9GAMM|nr:hypothetical protein KY46_03100 [Photobacterium halotolerans]